ncbi:MAG: hypothetical protein PHU05_02335 [Bacilli bacterium]|nr:hypothetical protein [Bacilli bacterium]
MEEVMIINISFAEKKKLIILNVTDNKAITGDNFNGVQLETHFIPGEKTLFDRIKNLAGQEVELVTHLEKRGNFYKKTIDDIKQNGNSYIL